MNNSKNAGKVMSVQLGRDETRIALLGAGDQIQHSIILPTPAGAVEDGTIQNPEAIRNLLKNVLQEPDYKRCRQVVFTLCTSQVITETVITPDLPAQRLEKLLLSNMDMYFPVDMQDYKLVWQAIGPKNRENGSKELQVQLWAVPVAMLSRYYNVANACGLSVKSVDYCGHSIATAVGASFSCPTKSRERKKLSLKTEISFGKKKEKEEEKGTQDATQIRQQPDTTLHICLESDLLGVTFVQGGQVMLQRFIRCGANPMHQFDELAMMVEYFRSMEVGRGSCISGVVSGGLAEDARLVAELGYALNIPLEPLAADYAPKWVLCMGAANNTLDFGIPSLDRPGKAGKQIESQLWQYVSVLAAGLVLVAAVLVMLTSRLSWDAELANLKSRQQSLLLQVRQTSKYADKYDKYNSEYNKYSSDWETIFGSLRTYNDNLVLVLEELEGALPQNTSVTGLQISADGLTVQFACSSKEEAAYLIMALRELEYAELAAISNLSGGGGGPATSYGPDGTEAPPTEGSSGLTEEEKALIASLISANIDQQELMSVIMGLSDSELERLENVYGKKPTNTYANMALLRSAYATRDIFQQRSDALHEMLTTNPFAIKRFVEMVEEDLYRSDPILLWYIYEDLLLPQNEDLYNALTGGSIESPEKAYEYMERTVAILTKDEDTLTATEDLISTDTKMERWYIYYLEMELGLQEKSTLGFLNMDRVVEDMMEGSFNTGDKKLDKKLNDLVPKDVWDALKKMGSSGGGDNPNPNPNPDDKKKPTDYTRADLLVMLNKYNQTGKTGDDYLDTLIDNFLATGSTGDADWDAWLEQYKQYLPNGGGGTDTPTPPDPVDGKKPSDYTQSELIAMLYKYRASNTTGDDYLDSLIDNYLATGSTGDADWDAFLEPYKEYLQNFIDDNKNPGSNGSTRYPYYITVSLKYKEALKNAELDRHGMNREDKIEKVEVLK